MFLDIRSARGAKPKVLPLGVLLNLEKNDLEEQILPRTHD